MYGGMGREWRSDQDRASEALRMRKLAATDRPDLPSRSHSFTLDRYQVLKADIAYRVRELIRQTCMAYDVHILKGHVSKDHVHL